jgi:flagellar biosynthesis GTPase FlhF
MKIKSFIAPTVQEALKSVKREMGDDSIILETRTIEEGDIKSKDGQTLIEVVAAENTNSQNAGQNSDQNEDQKDEQNVQDDSGNLNLQSPGQNPPDTSQSDQQQSEQSSSDSEHKDLPEDQMGNIFSAGHLHSDNLTEPTELTPKDRLSNLSDTAQAGAVRQVSKWIVGSKVGNATPHVSHDIKNNGGNLNLQSPDQNPPDTSQSDQQQSEQCSSVSEHKDLPEDQMVNVISAGHLHANNLVEPTESTPKDSLSNQSDTAQTGEVGQISKWIVGSKVGNAIPHVSHDIKNNGGNSNLLSPTRYPSKSSPSDRYPSEQYSSVKKQTSLPRDQMSNVGLADHLLTEELIEMAGYSADEISVPLLHHQNCDLNYGDWPGQSRELFKQLRIQQVEEEHSRLLINEVLCRLSKNEYDRMDLHSHMLRESIMHKIKIPDSSFHSQEECKTMVVIGAAGTGKTTTIAKLASDTKKRSDKEILLVTIRGYSSEKLKKTADRIGATLRTVSSNRELREIGDKNEGSSHIFIDTPGISYLDDNALSGIKGILDEMPNMETHLVVNATTRYVDIINIINKFAVFPIDRLLFTMVDETSLYGTLFSVAMETQIPLSCISDGQDIPEDIRPVTAKIVADMVLQA